MANEEIRNMSKQYNVPQWKIADKLGVCEQTYLRWLRHELPEDKRKAVIDAINEIATVCFKQN